MSILKLYVNSMLTLCSAWGTTPPNRMYGDTSVLKPLNMTVSIHRPLTQFYLIFLVVRRVTLVVAFTFLPQILGRWS